MRERHRHDTRQGASKPCLLEHDSIHQDQIHRHRLLEAIGVQFAHLSSDPTTRAQLVTGAAVEAKRG
jgi:hypothetical protein